MTILVQMLLYVGAWYTSNRQRLRLVFVDVCMYACMCGVQIFHRMRVSVHAYGCCTVLCYTIQYSSVRCYTVPGLGSHGHVYLGGHSRCVSEVSVLTVRWVDLDQYGLQGEGGEGREVIRVGQICCVVLR